MASISLGIVMALTAKQDENLCAATAALWMLADEYGLTYSEVFDFIKSYAVDSIAADSCIDREVSSLIS